MNEEKVEKTEDKENIKHKENIKRKDNLIEKLKQFTKTRWFPLIVAVTLVALAVGVVLIMLLFGWRITYAPELENNWDAISGVAAWFGVIISILSAIASFMAVWYAIRVADKQNKIALFEKRYECFQCFEECFILYKKLKSQPLEKVIAVQCCHMLEVEKINSLSKHDFQNKVKRFEYTLHQIPFLFPGIKEEDTSTLYYALAKFLAAILDKKDVEEKKQIYLDTMDKFSKYSDEIWKSVTISDIE